MRGRPLRIATAVLVSFGAVSAAGAASPVPYLRSVAGQKGHVIAVFTLDELAPARISVATKPALQRDGSFIPANVRFSEQMAPTRVQSGYRWRTRHTVPHGRYYVQVSGKVVGLDCTPHKPCKTDWSNVRRLRIR